jgi:hypothetical protein
MHVEHCQQKHFKGVKNMGCLRLNFLLLAVNDSGESISRSFEYKTSTKIRQNSKLLSGVSIGTKICRLLKKGVKNLVGLSLSYLSHFCPGCRGNIFDRTKHLLSLQRQLKIPKSKIPGEYILQCTHSYGAYVSRTQRTPIFAAATLRTPH